MHSILHSEDLTVPYWTETTAHCVLSDVYFTTTSDTLASRNMKCCEEGEEGAVEGEEGAVEGEEGVKPVEHLVL